MTAKLIPPSRATHSRRSSSNDHRSAQVRFSTRRHFLHRADIRLHHRETQRAQYRDSSSDLDTGYSSNRGDSCCGG